MTLIPSRARPLRTRRHRGGSAGRRRRRHRSYARRATPEFYSGLNALFARTTTGVLLDYDSAGSGVMSGNAVYQTGSGWNGYTITG